MDALIGWLLIIAIGVLIYRFRHPKQAAQAAPPPPSYSTPQIPIPTALRGETMPHPSIGHRYTYEGELFITKDGTLGVTGPNTLDNLPLADQLKRVLYQRLDINSTVTFDKVRITIERIEE